ncbi:hypothetical protein H2199_006960 [Coniosporium tulheliwenetii]|uniref:Uncharacterized protein n=1 Tax=Coniosporium tulheliwenetii TaxID=3383036 RepID=A0ACC2YS99_9PEZI|nr:hypothetical protein H2199_006960 [Cladosporium sp. JES 115]
MPGFRQMIVKVKDKHHGSTATTSDALESTSGHVPSLGHISPALRAQEEEAPLEIPLYDTSDVPPSPLITHLCQTFFAYLGCSFPFLQQERFMRDLEEKQVDTILVDAVCALAARFSNDPMLTGKGKPQQESDQKNNADKSTTSPSEYGQAFASRAHSAIVDTFACPSVAVVQAALLLAYDEFGAGRDSGLWMYLGIAIRMAQDFGMQKLEGLRFEGRSGPTPRSIKSGIPSGSSPNTKHSRTRTTSSTENHSDPQSTKEQRAVERERIDTFWAVFFLDRVISSGTGRPVTLRDRDIEISFPSLEEVDPATGWPLPFPALIRIVHLYGRVTDVLNSITEESNVTPDVLKRLTSMESQLTVIYQGLSPRLHFNALNFQHYVKMNQGPNFVLLHFWFHALIVLLHQPTLLKAFEGRIQHRLPNSWELSMSSAKTIADILAFAELIDPKSGIVNPFTSQPLYIAACAFLKEATLYTASSNHHSRQNSPPEARGGAKPENPGDTPSTAGNTPSAEHSHGHTASASAERLATVSLDQKQVAKSTLLASAANQNYQRCHRALQSLETYWAGVKYILTVLDQKAKGVGDPLLYTREEMESALEVPQPELAFTSPGWRRKRSWGTYLGPQGSTDGAQARPTAATHGTTVMPGMGGLTSSFDPNHAIGWSLTGNMDSPNTSLAVLYPNENRDPNNNPTANCIPAPPSLLSQSNPAPTAPMYSRGSFETSNTSAQDLPPPLPTYSSNQPYSQATISSVLHPPNPYDPSLVSDADLLLNLHSPYPANSPHLPPNGSALQAPHQQQTSAVQNFLSQGNLDGLPPRGQSQAMMPFGDMMIESQDIDVSALGVDMMPWLEYLPHEMLGFYDAGDGGAQG